MWNQSNYLVVRGSRGRDHMVVGVTGNCALSPYHNLSCEFEPRSC